MKIPEVLPENCNILYRADCKEALQNLIDRKLYVDLIYLDPPFNSNRKYSVYCKDKDGNKIQEEVFYDTFNYTTQTEKILDGFYDYLDEQEGIDQEVVDFLKIMFDSLKKLPKSSSILAYLIRMAERLVLCHKILKDTGSIYYHCDPTASHYIKIIMDGIFGSDNFKNEIVWSYQTGGVSKKWFGKKHDIILFYSKTKNYFIDLEKVKEKRTDEVLRRLKTGNKNATRATDEYRMPFDVWNIQALNAMSNERVVGNYPTQKPEALLDRIIEASCPEKGLVLDPYCGCGTTIASAKRLKRRWVGIDILPNAIDIIKDRLTGDVHYVEYDASPENRKEYDKLDVYGKQDFLVTKIGGTPNPTKSGDGGVDGTLKVYLGEKEGKDVFGKLVFSVKTGKQSNPKDLRELMGTVNKVESKADMGVLILEEEPSIKMINSASKQGQIACNYKVQEKVFDKIQIFTLNQLLDNNKAIKNSLLPITVKDYRFYKHEQEKGRKVIQ